MSSDLLPARARYGNGTAAFASRYSTYCCWNKHPKKLWTYFADARYSFTHRRLARLYTQLEEFDRAEEHWLEFLETFTDPDPEFQWMLDEARSELERLGRGR